MRQVIDLTEEPLNSQAHLIYKTVAGCNAYETGLCTLQEFRRWARFEVVQKDGRWRKVLTVS